MTTIGTSLVITGDLSSDEDLTIHGRVHGTVSVRAGTLTIGEQAQMRSDVRGARVVVKGAVDGSIAATERIELHPSAVVSGSLSANHVVIADAATFNGRIDMDRRTIAAKVAQYKADQGARSS
jgi:cytoskeletal protein CcmA (bactofilin family)